MTAKPISFAPEVLKAKLRALEEYGRCMTRRPIVPHPPPGNGTERWTFCVSSTDKRSVDTFTLAHVDPSGHYYTERGREAVLASIKSPFGISGQRLWVRERAMVATRLWRGALGWKVVLRYDDGGKSEWIDYPSRLVEPIEGRCIANGVFREGARRFLDVVEVRAERVMEISEHDALLEGIDPKSGDWIVPSFHALYESIYGAGAHARDWCWVYTLKRAES